MEHKEGTRTVIENSNKSEMLAIVTDYCIYRNHDIYTCYTHNSDGDTICHVLISISNSYEWTISQWFTDNRYRDKGIGKETMRILVKYLCESRDKPKKVNYTWNGDNEYVLWWMERHFNAKCTCPLAVQKKQPDDDWDSHNYVLEVRKFLEYFKI